MKHKLFRSFTSTPTQIAWVLISFLVAVTVTYVLAAISQTALVLQALETAGASFPLTVWLQTMLRDLYGLAFGGKYVSYYQTIVIGLGIALPTAALSLKWLPLPRSLVYAVAGATAMATILFVVERNFYNLTLFAGTRGWPGFCTQLLAGALGGWIFALLAYFQRGEHHET